MLDHYNQSRKSTFNYDYFVVKAYGWLINHVPEYTMSLRQEMFGRNIECRGMFDQKLAELLWENK